MTTAVEFEEQRSVRCAGTVWTNEARAWVDEVLDALQAAENSAALALPQGEEQPWSDAWPRDYVGQVCPLPDLLRHATSVVASLGDSPLLRDMRATVQALPGSIAETEAEPLDLDLDTIHPPGPPLTPIRELFRPEIDAAFARATAAEAREAELRRRVEALAGEWDRKETWLREHCHDGAGAHARQQNYRECAAALRALLAPANESSPPPSETQGEGLGRHEPARAFIEGDAIAIRLPIANLVTAYNGGVDVGAIDPGFKVTDVRLFAPDVVRALNDEDEQGTTPIHRLFDAAMTDAIEQGADGVEEDPPCAACDAKGPRTRRGGR